METKNFYFEQGIQFIIAENFIIDYEIYPFVFDFNDLSAIIEDTIHIYDENNIEHVKEEIVTTLLIFKNDFKVHIPMSLELFLIKYGVKPNNITTVGKSDSSNNNII